MMIIMPKKTTLQRKISFIIVNYKSAATLRACIASISSHVPRAWEYEVILVNNDRQKISQEVHSTADTVVDLGRNYGYGYANNRGAEVAQGELICLLNPDTYLLSSIAPILQLFCTRHSDIVGPQLVTVDHSIQQWSAGTDMTLWELIRSHTGCARSKKVWQAQEVTEADWVSGAALFIRRALFEELQGFDETFFLYWEDIDLCRRARQNDARVLYCPQVQVQHISGASSSDKKQQKRHYDASQDHYFRKHFSPITGSLVRLVRTFYRFVK